MGCPKEITGVIRSDVGCTDDPGKCGRAGYRVLVSHAKVALVEVEGCLVYLGTVQGKAGSRRRVDS